MKNLRITALFVAAVLAIYGTATAQQHAPAAQQSAGLPTPTTPSRVTEALVFMRGAELTHTATATIKKGAGEVVIEGLSADLDPSSVKVRIGGGVVVSAFDFAVDHLGGGLRATPRQKMLADSAKIYLAIIERLDVERKVNQGLQGYLETGIAKSVSGGTSGLGMEELRRAMDYYKSRSEEILSGEQAIAKRRRKAVDALALIQKQQREESENAGAGTGRLRLSYSAPAAGNQPMVITYYTAAASWSPYYDINAPSTRAPIGIGMRARVRQTTGIEWDNVRLTLSTAAPTSGKVAPLFSTWFLREKPHTRVKLNTVMNTEKIATQNAYSYDDAAVDEIVVEGYGAEKKEVATPSMEDHVTTAAGALDITYNIDIAYTIPSGGKAQTIDLGTRETPAEFKYYCAPRLDGAVYLIAEIADWEGLGLLSAPAGVTYGGTYLGETTIDASQTHEKLALTLGTDRRVSVTREVAREFTQARSVGSTTEQTFTWRLTVRNGQSVPIRMVLKDQYPVSTDRAVTVTLDTRATTPPTANIPETGVVTWEEELAAGEVRSHTISYTVKYPKGMVLNL